jgi:hypothetical protein
MVKLLVLAAAALHVSARGGKYGFVYRSRHRAYRGMAKTGLSKTSRARIANAGKTHADRVRMARKAARTRKRRGR